MNEMVITSAENGWIIKFNDKIYVADDMYGLKNKIAELLAPPKSEEQ